MKDGKFTVDEVRSISTAGSGLLKWVFAMVNYNNVAKTVEPKRRKVAESEKNLRSAQKDLNRIKGELEKLNEQLQVRFLNFVQHPAGKKLKWNVALWDPIHRTM